MADFYQIFKSEDTGKHVVHFIRNGNIEETRRYASVRAGVSFPSEEGSGAFCIIGQELQDKFEVFSGPLRLLDEWEFSGFSVDQFWDRVSDSIVLHIARPVYFDIQDEANLLAFRDYCSRRKPNLDHQEAPFANNFFTGLATCNDWLREGRLDLPKTSMVRSQLKSITRNDLKDTENPGKKFALINALRHVCSGYRKFPDTPPLAFGENFGHGHPQGWMV